VGDDPGRGARDLGVARAAADAERSRRRRPRLRGVAVFTLLFGWFILPFALLARLLSRYRELAAGGGAARPIGSPAALASALTSLADDLRIRERRDLRVVAARDLLQILPTRDPRPARRAACGGSGRRTPRCGAGCAPSTGWRPSCSTPARRARPPTPTPPR
jgi:hypothetical protein